MLESPLCVSLIFGVLVVVVAEMLARKEQPVLAKPKRKRQPVLEDDSDLDEPYLYGILDDMDRADRER